MVKTLSDHEQPDFEAYQHPGMEAARPYRTVPYWTCWTPCGGAGQVPAAQVLRVNFRTLSNCRGFR